ncbi:glycosyltransferase family protein [Brumimicrobium mesophilum]|uniref:hypothetical protein n=1 Tax=Brumimicrobium mesophilum TaxID=392717 RepID=UPI000D13EFCA|nr:hypothetical protein [Brumimicrobium mesophilum]
MKKNVLIISYAYPPNNVAGAQRPYALAKHLDKKKYNVKVVTCDNPDLSIGENKKFDPTLDGVEIIKIRSKIGNSASQLRPEIDSVNNKTSLLSKLKSIIFKTGQRLIFPDKGMFWTPNVKTYLKQNQKLIRDTDIVFSTSPGVTSHQIAQLINRKNKSIQWIADFRDFNYVENWSDKRGIKAQLHKRMETSFLKEAAAITFVTKTMQNAYQDFYPQYRDKMNCVYNGFENKEFKGSANFSVQESKLSFFYAGSFYNGQRSPFTLMQLIDKAIEDNLITEDEVEIRIAGNIEADMKLEMKNFKSYSCLEFLGTIPRIEVLEQMNNSSFLWLIVANLKSHYQTVPIKLFEYIAARRPIINFAPSQSESSQIIKKNNLGYNFETLEFNLEENYLLFKELLFDFKNGQFDEPLSDLSLKDFTWDNQIKQIENLF